MLRALPASAALFSPKISALGLPPYPFTPFSFGGYPHPGYPTPFAFFVFFPLHAQPHLCRVPLVHAAAAWHRSGNTPLMDAAHSGATAAVASLIKLRANLDAQNNVG